jgi:hypothetical protein
MKLRRCAGALLVAAALAACEGATPTEPTAAAGPLMERKRIPPGLEDNSHIPFDTSGIHTGYFGSGHYEPLPDTLVR